MSLLALMDDILPILRYTADKATYFRLREEEHCTGYGLTEYDQWAKSRARFALSKWDEIKEQIRPEERAEMDAVNELQIAQLIEQRDALIALIKGLPSEGGFDATAPEFWFRKYKDWKIKATYAIALAEGRAE